MKTLLSALTGGLQGWAVAFFETEAAALQNLVGVTAQRRHLWCAIWAQMSLRPERLDQPENISLWCERLLYARGAELIERAGFQTSRGFRRVLGKLGWCAFERPETYLRAADILAGGGSPAKVLRHLSCLNEKALYLLDAIPAEISSVALVERCLKGDGVQIRDVVRIPWRIERLKIAAPQSLAVWEARIAGGAVLGTGMIDDLIPFPAPPWIGTDDLRPLDDVAKLTDVSRRFKNCLTHHVGCVRTGQTYFYELRGLAVVELERVGALGWEIAFALGPRNEPLSPEATNRLVEALGGAPEHICRNIPVEVEYAV